MLQKALHEKEPNLLHSESNESLFQELQQVAKAEPGMVSKAVASRNKGDRKEIERILGHLPMIREYREKQRHPVPSVPSSQTPRPQSSQTPRPQSSNGTRRVSRESKGEGPMSARYMPRPPMSARKTAWDDAPKSARVQRPASRGEDVDVRSRQPPCRPATPRLEDADCKKVSLTSTPPPGGICTVEPQILEVHVDEARPATPAMPRANTVQDEAWYQQALKTAAASARLGFAAIPLDDEVPDRKDVEEEKARKRYLRKLAEVGIDPKGMMAGDILRLLYARESSTTYRRMNKEAQKKLLVRVRTPLCMRTVLKERALQEVKAARDKPAELVHECLDRWEIDTMAEVCRSLKFFDEEAARTIETTYLRSYGGRQYMEPYHRKPFLRPPTA